MLAFAPVTAMAAGRLDPTKRCTITLTYSSGGNAFKEYDIKLYHVANATEDGEYNTVGSFSGYSIRLKSTASRTEWRKMTSTVASYVTADKIAPDYSIATDENGKAVFTDLIPGMYFIPAFKTEIGGRTYTFDAFLVAVPGLDADGEWTYGVNAAPKANNEDGKTPDKKPDPGKTVEPDTDPEPVNPDEPIQADTVTYKAVKTWKDSGNSERPDSVAIAVYKDGEEWTVQDICAENGWVYTWTVGNDGSVWTVAERNVPNGYEVEIDQNGNTFTITNSAVKTEASGNAEPPQTGDSSKTYLYFAAMLASGIMLIILGLLKRRRNNEA